MLYKLRSFCFRNAVQVQLCFWTILSTTIASGVWRSWYSFSCFRGHVVFEGIYFFFCICDNRPWHFLRCRFSVLFGWTLSCHFLGRVHRIFLFSCCRERKRFFMPLQEFVVQFKTRKNIRLTLKNAFVCFWLFKRWQSFWKHLNSFFAFFVVLQFYDSCYVYVDAKQYHLASFSIRNSTLNTSLR